MDYVRLRGHPIERMLIGNRFTNTLKKDFQIMSLHFIDFKWDKKSVKKFDNIRQYHIIKMFYFITKYQYGLFQWAKRNL